MSEFGHGEHLKTHRIGNEEKPIPVILFCPRCRKQHIDEGEWETRSHHTHQCVDGAYEAGCGHTWRAAPVATVGVTEIA